MLLALLSLLGGPVAKGYVNGHGDKLVGRQVHVDRVGLNLFTGSVNVRGLNLYEEDGKTSFVSFDTLSVRARLLRVLGKTLDVRRLSLSGLHVNVVQDGSHFNFSSIIDHFKSGDEKEKDTTPSDWTLRFGEIRLSHARAAYHDLQRDKQWLIADMNLLVPGFVIGGKENTQAGLNIKLADGGLVNINSDFDSKSNKIDAALTVSDFAMSNIREYLTGSMDIDKLEGTLDAKLRINGRLDEVMRSRLSGDVELSELGVLCNEIDNDEFVTLNSLKVNIKEVNLEDRRFALGSVAVDGLAATYEQWEDGNTLSRLLRKPRKNAEVDTSEVAAQTEVQDTVAPKPENDMPLRLTVGQLTVSGSNITYINHTLPDKFKFPVTGINVEARNVSTQGRNNANLRASLPGGGTMAIRWEGNISELAEYQDLLVVINGLDMKQLSPWSVAYTGYPIEDGIFGLMSHNTINGGKIDGRNKLDIYMATVGDRRKDVEPIQKIPLKTALYLLKDKDEKINIELPVTGNVYDPEFNYMKIVWKTLGNLLVKVATSPVRAIAGKSLGNGLDFIEMTPEQFGFTSQQYHSLGELAQLMLSEPALTLTMKLHGMDSLHTDVVNSHLRQYMDELGVPESQLKIAVGGPSKRTGYAVTSELKLED